ncbi:hypothetical protein GCM10011309_10520 [Litorimonas cladophorae]|uniref:Uncharacterized protein n=1 Tax=Litorimonas cladophorae TaxID=1220491 RepID=A0A918NER6_9PROT|nr:hypothetical protein [Litorimonas cladophorae]GGX62444.1 hypothetical protein GCM10011309_10520 [Litorimonas cladophorae]
MDETPENTVMQDWAEIEALFPTRGALRPSKSWTNGISTRAGVGRLSRMLDNRGAGPLAAKLDQMDDARVKALRTIAAVNLEQAAQGFRVSLVANVTVPVLILTILNQLTEQGIGHFLKSAYGEAALYGLIAGFLTTVLLVGLMIAFTLASLNQARDIRHIIDLQAAERGIYFGLEDAGDMTSV